MERTLSQTEAKVVLDLEWRDQRTVTLADRRILRQGRLVLTHRNPRWMPRAAGAALVR
jgi:hypothetical protein